MFSLAIFAAVLAASFLLTRSMLVYSTRFNLLDHPTERSSHTRTTPRGGGLAIVLASLAAFTFGSWTGLLRPETVWAVSIAGGLVAGAGFWDDHRSLSPLIRIVVQLSAATILLAIIGSPASLDFGFIAFTAAFLPPFAFVILLAWLVNLANFMDGIDGIAAAECAFVTIAGGALAWGRGDNALAFLCFAVAAAALGFAVINWPPAKIFLGDVGSGYLGLIYGAAMLVDCAREPVRVWVWLILLGAFLTDATLTLIRRFAAGEAVHLPHRSHAYQHAAARWGHKRTTLVFIAVNLFWLGPLAYVASEYPRYASGLFVVAVCPLCIAAWRMGAGTRVALPSKSTLPKEPTMLSTQSLSAAIVRLSHKPVARYIAMHVLHAALVILAGLSAFLLRFEFTIPASMKVCMLWGLTSWVIVKPLAFSLSSSRSVWRFFSVPDLVRLARTNILASVAGWMLLTFLCPVPFPRSIAVIDFALMLLLTAAVRALVRLAPEFSARLGRTKEHRTFIYGAGAAGVLLLREARENLSLKSFVCGFIDDSRPKGTTICGVSVLGAGADLKELASRHGVTQVLIATPSATGAQMARIIEHCQTAGVTFRTMPAMSEIISGKGLTRQIRDVAVDDVLGRSAVELDRAGIDARIRGSVVLVTGAAGSIGSELCRQIAACKPGALVALDIAETPLFHIERELRESHPTLNLYPVIASVQNVQRLHEVFALHRPKIVYHAAAYKHVPMMEVNVFEAIENNVIGTYNVAVAASEYGVDDFVMISSDKAVRPTNIMGATKRASELIIRSLQNGGPRYVSVRFGNVLGSNGSVVPIFKKQIAAGGPVTVTHPEMRRYFMTIPEAVQLVLQASTLGKGGEIFVLDMGTPVKIVDLARQLILLSGLKPDEDIRIEFSGMRPGEKLYEELRFSSEEVLPTAHKKIKVFAGECPPERRMAEHLARLRGACDRRDFKAVLFELKEIEPDYNPSKEALMLAFGRDLARLAKAVENPEFVAPTVVSPVLASGD